MGCSRPGRKHALISLDERCVVNKSNRLTVRKKVTAGGRAERGEVEVKGEVEDERAARAGVRRA